MDEAIHRLLVMGRAVRDALLAFARAADGASPNGAAADSVVRDDAGDTIFLLDEIAERELLAHCDAWGKVQPLLLVAEGPEAGGRTFGGGAFGGGASRLHLIADPIDGCPVPSVRLAALMAQGARLRARRFLALRTRARSGDPPPIERISVLVSEADRALEIHRGLDPVTDAVIEARDLVDEPANRLTPAVFVERARALEKLGVEIEVKDEPEPSKAPTPTPKKP